MMNKGGEKHERAISSGDVRFIGLPIRLLVGLHYLKYAYNESDESVV